MTVYPDVVIFFNFIADYLILKSVKIITGAGEKRPGIFISSLLGGIYSVFMFDERMKIIYSLPFQALVSAIMLLLGLRCRKMFLKVFICFYITAFAFSGAAAFAENLSGVIVMKNGILYSGNSIFMISACLAAAFFLITYFLRSIVMRKKIPVKKEGITVCVDGRSVEINGLFDTGNSLLDPITLYPVVVVEYDKIKDILPGEMLEFLKEGRDLNFSMSRKYSNRIRLIPYNSVGANEILKGFRPDYIKINGREECIKDVIIAVVYKKLSLNNDFDAILHPLI